MKFILINLILLSLNTLLFSQKSFVKSINNMQVSGNYLIRKTTDGGWLTATSSPTFNTNSNKNGLVLIKYSKCASIEWSKYYTFDNKFYNLSDFMVENNGNIVILGYTVFYDSYNIDILNLNSNGNVIWNKTVVSSLYGISYSIGKTTDNNYFLFGMCEDIQASAPRNYILKFSPSGNLIWSNNYFANPIWGEAVAVEAGNILVRSGNLIYKVNSNGNIVWGKQYAGLHYACKPVVENNGYIYVRYPSSLSDSICNIFKIGLSGNLIFTGNAFVGNQLGSIKKINNGNFLITGNHKSSNSLNIIECSSTGQIISQRLKNNTGGLSTENGNDFIQLPDNSLIISGKSNNTGISYLVKTDNNQSIKCGEHIIVQNVTSQNLIISEALDHNYTNNVFLDNANVISQNINLTETFSCYIPDTLKLNLGNDTTLCAGKNFILKSNITGAYSYLWSTGETTPQITVNKTGSYWLRQIACDTIIDTININFTKGLNINYTIKPKIVDLGEAMNFNNFTSAYQSYYWDTDDGNTYTNNSFEHIYQLSGYFHPKIHHTDSFNCEYIDSTTVEVRFISIYIPNSFTPNGDGLNEVFEIKGEGIKSYVLYIYNRWGELIYTAENHGWNGYYLRNPIQIGTYHYKAEIKDIFGKNYQKTGSVTLIR